MSPNLTLRRASRADRESARPTSATKEPRAFTVLDARAFVWATWAALTALASFIVWRQGPLLPWSDDWAMIGAVTHAQPMNFSWLWAQHNEHRIVIPKLFFVLSAEWSEGDYRWQILGNIVALGAAAALLLNAVRLARGRLTWVDAFIPLTLLNFGQGAMWWGFYFQFVSVTALSCALLAGALAHNGAPTLRSALHIGLCLLALPLCGGSGLLVTLALAPWFAFRAVLELRARSAGKQTQPESNAPPQNGRATGATLLLICACGAGALCIAYFIGYVSPPNRVSAGALLTLRAALRALGACFGYLGAEYHPYAAILIGTLLVGSIAYLLRRVWREKISIIRAPRLWDLGAFLVAMVVLMLGVGYGRGGIWTESMGPHYTSLASPVLIAIYATVALAFPAALARALSWSLLAVMVALNSVYIPNLRRLSRYHSQQITNVAHDLSTGVPASAVTDHYINQLSYVDTAETRAQVVSGIKLLRSAGYTRYGPPRQD